MDDIKVYQTLVRAACSGQSGIGDIRDAVWKGIDAAGLSSVDRESDGYRYINVFSTWIASVAAGVMFCCLVAGYVIVDNYQKGEAMLSPYYDIIDRLGLMAWGIF